MAQIGYSIVGFILAIAILVAFHEFGHYWVARRLGVKVLRFSIGFGKPLWTWRGGADDVEYVVGAIPLGGYVKMLDENEAEVAPHELHRAFNRQGLLIRGAIVLAGPLFNFLFAIVAYWAVFVIGVDGIRPLVGSVAAGSVAAQSGIRVGDEIIEIDGRPNRSWDEHRLYLFNEGLQRNKVPIVVVDAEGRKRALELDLSGVEASAIDRSWIEDGLGLRVYLPPIPALIGEVVANAPGAIAGLQTGDRILRLAGQPVESWSDVVTIVQARPEQSFSADVERQGQELTLSITPNRIVDNGREIGRIEVGPMRYEFPEELRVRVGFGPLEAIWHGVDTTWTMSALTVRMLIKMIQLEVSTKNISGPITIAHYAGQTVQMGFDRFLLFLAIISISLGILNLLPIPVLDGGHLLYYIAEAITGGPLPKSVLLWGQQIGILLLVALMTLAFYNDIVRFLQ